MGSGGGSCSCIECGHVSLVAHRAWGCVHQYLTTCVCMGQIPALNPEGLRDGGWIDGGLCAHAPHDTVLQNADTTIPAMHGPRLCAHTPHDRLGDGPYCSCHCNGDRASHHEAWHVPCSGRSASGWSRGGVSTAGSAPYLDLPIDRSIPCPCLAVLMKAFALHRSIAI